MRRLLRRSCGVAGGITAGVLAALLPSIAAASHGDRALDPPADMGTALLLAGLVLAAGLVLTSIGYLYRRQRGLHWDYQLPHGALSEGQTASTDDHDESSH